jgi:hypothetical protein
MYLLSFYGSIRTVDKNEVTWSVVRWQEFYGYEITTSFETTKATTTHRVCSTFMILQQWTSFGISRATTHRFC